MDMLSTLRPRDDSSGAIHTALLSVRRERQAAAQRLEAARENRRTALGDFAATPQDVAMFEVRLREAEIEIERLDVLEPDLEQKLRAALASEAAAAQQAVVDAARRDLEEADAALQTELPDYEVAARRIAEVCRLEQARAAAAQQLRAVRVAQAPQGAHLPAEVSDLAVDLAKIVVLPGVSSAEPIWKVVPPPPDPRRNLYRVEAEIYGRGRY